MVDEPLLLFMVILSISIVCPYVVSFSYGIKLFFIQEDENNNDINTISYFDSSAVRLKRIVMYLSISPVGALWFVFLV